MNHTIIQTTDLTKKYRRYRKKEGLRGSISSLWKREYEEKIAVHEMIRYDFLRKFMRSRKKSIRKIRIIS